MAGLGGLSKLHKMQDTMKGKEKPAEHGKVGGETGEQPNGGEPTTTITHHADGTHTMVHDGEESKHPDHMHMLAHLGHKVTGGDKHHIAHHDGMSLSTHGIHESGEHEGPHEHNSAEEAKEAFGHFMDEEAQEPQHQGGGEEPEPAYGGMMG